MVRTIEIELNPTPTQEQEMDVGGASETPPPLKENAAGSILRPSRLGEVRPQQAGDAKEAKYFDRVLQNPFAAKRVRASGGRRDTLPDPKRRRGSRSTSIVTKEALDLELELYRKERKERSLAALDKQLDTYLGTPKSP